MAPGQEANSVKVPPELTSRQPVASIRMRAPHWHAWKGKHWVCQITGRAQGTGSWSFVRQGCRGAPIAGRRMNLLRTVRGRPFWRSVFSQFPMIIIRTAGLAPPPQPVRPDIPPPALSGRPAYHVALGHRERICSISGALGRSRTCICPRPFLVALSVLSYECEYT